jgi:N-glycosylase/DNA lyase
MLLQEPFDLKLTLASGQFFRYEDLGNEFLLLTQGKAIRLSQQGNVLSHDGCDEMYVRRLFRLDGEYGAALTRLGKDPVLAPIIVRYPGLRLMQQDLHETIIGFMCSVQSNIPKIKMNLRLLSEFCGSRIGDHAFLPRHGIPLDPVLVRQARTGYRAKSLVAANVLLTHDFLEQLQTADYAQSHALLCSLPGIGPKVADCVCLFALAHDDAFPVDVHIARAMRTLFPKSHLTDEKRVRAFARNRWGKDAGLAQQFLFQWARDNLRG